MISTSSIMSALADAIEESSDVAKVVQQYPAAFHLFLGHPADQPLFAQDNLPAVAVYPGDAAYDLGDGAESREPSVSVRWGVYDADQESDGARTTFLGISRADALGHAIVAAAKAYAEAAGGWTQQADYTIDGGATWPICGGTCRFVFHFERPTGTSEPALA